MFVKSDHKCSRNINQTAQNTCYLCIISKQLDHSFYHCFLLVVGRWISWQLIYVNYTANLIPRHKEKEKVLVRRLAWMLFAVYVGSKQNSVQWTGSTSTLVLRPLSPEVLGDEAYSSRWYWQCPRLVPSLSFVGLLWGYRKTYKWISGCCAN